MVENKTFPFFPIIKNTLRKDYIPLDLSIDSTEVSVEEQKNPEEMHLNLRSFLQDKGTVAYGGYLEKRALYERSYHFGTGDQRRNIHIGTDFWCEKGSVISCPFDGIVHSFKNNDNYGDYGPTIILKHFERNTAFYALYGHLSIESIKNLKVGSVFSKGDDLAKIGGYEENGNYAPHLHFQVMLDLGDHMGDYPGVISHEELDYYSSNCLDPEIILGI